MDPMQTLADVLSYLDEADGAADKSEERDDAVGNAVDAMRNLATWLERGGYPPDVRKAIARALPNYLEGIRDEGRGWSQD